MKDRTGKLFLLILTGMSVLLLCLPKDIYSASERRKLAQMPVPDFTSICDKSFMQETEEYLLDHFPLREQFRRMKAYFAYDILRQKENNGIYVADGYAGKLEYPLKETSVMKAADKMAALQNEYFPEAEVYYAIVPDRNYFLAQENDYPGMDYERLIEIMQQKLTNMTYIDIWDTLTIDDYYHTDTHWRQERLANVVERLGESMDFTTDMTPLSNNAKSDAEMEMQEIYPFYGVYYGQSALPLEPESIYYLTSDRTRAATVWNLETNCIEPVYRLDIISEENSFDKYDIYLGGAAALQKIESPLAESDKKLIIFRDSFASSLAPLLLEVYHEIILIDTRYIAPSLLKEYVDFEGAQVLFLYNTVLLNNASMLK